MRNPILLAMPLALLLTSCDLAENFGDSSRFREDFHSTHDFQPGGRIELESFNGSVEIAGWDQNKVDVSGTKYASTQDALDDLEVDISTTPGTIRIRSVKPAGRWNNMGVKYVISVPRKTVLESISSSNGSIHVVQIEGNMKLRSSNGSLKVEDSRGDLDANTSNGSVNLNGFTGGAVVKTSNGSIRAAGVKGFFEATTSNGSVDATIAEASPNRPIRVTSSNGKVLLTVESLNGSDIYASTSNSSVTVRLPAEVNARLKARTSNSSVNSDFEVKATGEISKKQLNGTIGSGGPIIDLHTSNAGIRIEKL